jgi:hypothetical protein
LAVSEAKVGGMRRRLYTPELASRSLPLVSRIASDVRDTAHEIRSLWLQKRGEKKDGHRDDGLERRLARLRRQFSDLIGELDTLGVELKDPLSGLLDFRALRGGREVYLCWRLGEEAVDYWHTLDGGFAGRRPMAEFYESSPSSQS